MNKTKRKDDENGKKCDEHEKEKRRKRMDSSFLKIMYSEDNILFIAKVYVQYYLLVKYHIVTTRNNIRASRVVALYSMSANNRLA
jgi:hypothetical protein